MERIPKKERVSEPVPDNEASEAMPDMASMMVFLDGMVYRCRNDHDWTMLYLSDGCKALTGYEPSRLIDNREISFNDLIHPDDREPVWRTVQDSLRDRRAFMIDYRILTATGEERWVHERGHLVDSGAGRRQKVEGFITDITELRSRARENRLLGEALRNVADAVIVTGMDDRIRYVNDAFTAIFGYSHEEAIGMPVDRLRVEDDDSVDIETIKAETLRGGWKGEIQNRRKDGTRFPVHLATSSTRDHLGKPIALIAACRDLTEERTMQRQLHQLQRMEVLGQFAGGIAHDFNNLLMVVQGSSDRLRFDAGPEREAMEQIARACVRGSALTRQLLGFSRQQVIQPKVMDLNEQIGESERMIQSLVADGIRLTTALDPDLGLIEADPGQIDQILLNLAANARDAMPDGGDLRIETDSFDADEEFRRESGLEAEQWIRLRVSDTGCGMDAATRQRIFEPFFTTKRQAQGTGLGLATVRGIVRQGGGHIRVTSEPGAGTSFEIYLPRVLRTTPAVAVPTIAAETSAATETILVVDDDLLVGDLTARLLRNAGYPVLKASNGEEALAMAEQFREPLPLMVTDVQMPGLSGYELARQLSHARPEMKVIFTTGYGVGEQETQTGGARVLQKPYTGGTLLKTVREALDSCAR